jgi:hypothetical protein
MTEINKKLLFVNRLRGYSNTIYKGAANNLIMIAPAPILNFNAVTEGLQYSCLRIKKAKNE